MNKFLTKHAVTIVIAVLALSVGGFSDSVLDRLLPGTGDITGEFFSGLVRDIVREENAPMKADIKQIKEQNQIFTDDMAEEWVRVMKKQYSKVQANRDDLSWDDVQFALSKWPILPDNWKSPELIAKIEYLEIKYDEHINNGGGS